MKEDTHPFIQTTAVCPAWLAGSLLSPIRRLFQNPKNILKGLAQPGQCAADFGCGPGFFTLEMARLVGPSGRVYAIDVQEEMLAIVRSRSAAMGILDRIVPVQVKEEKLGLAAQFDLVLLFWMVHEVPDRAVFLAEVAATLKPGGLCLLAEPRVHVSKDDFAETLQLARRAGLTKIKDLRIGISRAALLQKI